MLGTMVALLGTYLCDYSFAVTVIVIIEFLAICTPGGLSAIAGCQREWTRFWLLVFRFGALLARA